jgi:hypothetical protein
MPMGLSSHRVAVIRLLQAIGPVLGLGRKGPSWNPASTGASVWIVVSTKGRR